ncbi:MAG: LolA family protein [Planctomycetota bacterium]
MKGLILPVLLVLIVPRAADDDVSKVIAKVSAAYKDIKDFQMPFAQEKRVTILKDPIVSSGTVLWKTDRLLFRTLKPEKSEVLITDKEMQIWVPALKTIEKYDRTQHKLMATFDLAAGRQLKKMTAHYDVTIAKAHPRMGEDDSSILFRLVPKKEQKQIRKYIREMWQWVRRKDHLIFRVAYTDTSGDETVTTFDVDKMKKNGGLTDKDLRLSAPKGTKVVEPLKPKKKEAKKPRDQEAKKEKTGKETKDK